MLNYLGLYQSMLQIRSFEYKIRDLMYQNLVGGAAHLSVGQEAVAVGVCSVTHPDDYIYSTHRGHGHMIAKGADMGRMLAEILGRATGYCGGLGGSMHVADMNLGICGANGIVGGGLTLAPGAGLSSKLRQQNRIAICFFGDGAANQGGLHEALNLCSVWQLPVLYVCENNHYAMSTPINRSFAEGVNIAERAKGYNLKSRTVDGNDLLAVRQAAEEMVRDIRREQRTMLLECVTYRQEGHYCGDPCAYRNKEEVERWKRENDPIARYEQFLIAHKHATAEKLEQIKGQVDRAMDEAAVKALQEPEPASDTDLESMVFVDRWAGRDIPESKDSPTKEYTYRDAANRALDEELARDERVILFGEDVGVHGGAFQVSKGLCAKYGPDRVRDTPLSEEAIVGCALGAAATGLIPIAEIQYSDFMTLAMDQIVNQIAKAHYMFGGKVSAPLVLRAPCGAGGRGNAAQHSQSLEAWFMHVPGLKVVLPATPYDVVGLLKAAIRDPDPVIFLEHKSMYNNKGLVPQQEYLLPFGKADIKRPGKDVTIIATSRMVVYSLEAAELLMQRGVSVEVIDPRCLVPLDTDTILASVARTGKAVVVSEDCLTAGVSAELAALIAENIFDELDAPVLRLAGRNVPIPYNRKLEQACVPSVEKIVQGVSHLLGV
jgi:2-oxoisovalerate dehydrogenase E1 component